ncbi:MAG TPA: hypothetical protein VMT69_11710 [Kineosporiaceae bacterium]|nr:hypothetical protein [Kineosporiaceae bacterium]
MADDGQPTALDVVDLATGTFLATARLARRAVEVSLRWTPPVVFDAGRAGASLVTRLAGDLPNRLRDEGAAARETVLASAEERLLAAVRPVLDLVLDQIDLTDLVIHRVDLNRILDTLDLTDLVIHRVDLNRVAEALDLNRVARGLDVDAVAARLDIDAVINRVDLIGLAEYIVDGIDLPRIIRESTGSVASEGLREVRTRSIEADQALAQFVDRLLLRRRLSGGSRGAGAASPESAGLAASNGAPGSPDTTTDGSRAD